MAINIQTERVVTFREAAKHCPRRRRGKKPHVSTFYRWADAGLETIRVGGQLCTSLEALQRFFDRLSPVEGHNQESPGRQSPSRTAAGEARRQRRVEEKLESFGL